MNVKRDGQNWLIRFQKGELLVDNLIKFIKDEQITGAWITGLGASTDAELGFYDLEHKTYNWKRFNQLLEITSLKGNISWHNNEPVVHLHGTFADQAMQSYGGHVRELQVGGTVEMMLIKWNGEPLGRDYDKETGLKLLNI